MGKTSKSTTQNTYPQWLMDALQPLMRGSTQRLGEFQAQGHNILQGRPYNEGVIPATQGNRRAVGGGKIDPDLWAQIVASRQARNG